MIAVIFEVTPKDGQKGHYLDIAATMRPMVEQVEGFISVERFQSLTNPEKLLSISFFEDEAADAVAGTAGKILASAVGASWASSLFE